MNDNYYALERRLRAEIKEHIRNELASLVKLHPYTGNSADGTKDKVQGYQTEGSDEQAYDFNGRRVFPFGIRSRPPVGTFGVWLGVGGESGDGVIVAAESSRFGPSGLNDGEVALYNKVNGTTILLDQNGAVTVTDQNGSTVKLDGAGNINITSGTGNVVLNSGALNVARVTDQVTGTAGPYPIASGVISGPGATKVKG